MVVEFPQQDGLARPGGAVAPVAVVHAQLLELHPEHLGDVPEREAVLLRLETAGARRSLRLLAGQVHDGVWLQFLLVGEVVVAQDLLRRKVVGRGQGAVSIALNGEHIRHAVALQDLAGHRQGQPLDGDGDAALLDGSNLREAPRRGGRSRLGQRFLVIAVELEILDGGDQLVRVAGVCGVAGLLEPPRPALVVRGLQVEQALVALAGAQEIGMRPEGLLRARIGPEALLGAVVVFVERLPVPLLVALDPEMVIGLDGQHGPPGARLHERLGQRDAGRHAGAPHLGDSQGGKLLNIALVRVLGHAKAGHQRRDKDQQTFHLA